MEYTDIENTYENYDLSSSDEIIYNKITEPTIKFGASRYKNIMGITCYMNSILHILQHIPLFVKYIYNFEFEQILLDKIEQSEYTIHEYVIYELYRLFKISIDNDNSTIRPKTFKNLIGMKNDMWNEYNHQDSQEFFNFLISQIKEEVGLKTDFSHRTNYNHNRNINESINNIIATNALTTYQSHEYSILTELFDGLSKNISLCVCCKTSNIKFEPFLTLAIDIDINKHDNDLYECFDNLCSEQQLDVDNKLVCGFCGLSNRAFKKTLLWKTPKILVIHIKRFGISTQKITNNVIYPIKDLDMSNYIDPNSPFISESKYDLIGINLHETLGHSKNINAGHYTSIVKNRLNNYWYFYNDSNEPEFVTKKEDLQNNNAYLLFYYRHN